VLLEKTRSSLEARLGQRGWGCWATLGDTSDWALGDVAAVIGRAAIIKCCGCCERRVD
jgi:hypothetical protein